MANVLIWVTHQRQKPLLGVIVAWQQSGGLIRSDSAYVLCTMFTSSAYAGTTPAVTHFGHDLIVFQTAVFSARGVLCGFRPTNAPDF
jgi:hypothetical protein